MTKITKYALPSFLLAVAAAVGAFWLTDYWQSLLLSLSSVLLGLAAALWVINGFINQEERQGAAVVLMQMVHEDVSSYHSNFLDRGRERFGIPAWNGIIDAMNENQRDPNSLAPEQRLTLLEIIRENKESLLANCNTIDERFREISYILGWSFNPRITRNCISSRMEIQKFKTLASSSEELDDEQSKKLIELYFDIDADASAVLDSLADILGISLTE